MVDVEIKRGYEVLPDNEIRFGIRITNVSELAVFDIVSVLIMQILWSNLKGIDCKKWVSFRSPDTRP